MQARITGSTRFAPVHPVISCLPLTSFMRPETSAVVESWISLRAALRTPLITGQRSTPSTRGKPSLTHALEQEAGQRTAFPVTAWSGRCGKRSKEQGPERRPQGVRGFYPVAAATWLVKVLNLCMVTGGGGGLVGFIHASKVSKGCIPARSVQHSVHSALSMHAELVQL